MKMMLPDVGLCHCCKLKIRTRTRTEQKPYKCQLFQKLFSHISNLKTHNSQSALEFCPIHCPNGRLGQDLGFGGFAFALKLPKLLNTNLAAVTANILFP